MEQAALGTKASKSMSLTVGHLQLRIYGDPNLHWIWIMDFLNTMLLQISLGLLCLYSQDIVYRSSVILAVQLVALVVGRQNDG